VVVGIDLKLVVKYQRNIDHRKSFIRLAVVLRRT